MVSQSLKTKAWFDSISGGIIGAFMAVPWIFWLAVSQQAIGDRAELLDQYAPLYYRATFLMVAGSLLLCLLLASVVFIAVIRCTSHWSFTGGLQWGLPLAYLLALVSFFVYPPKTALEGAIRLVFFVALWIIFPGLSALIGSLIGLLVKKIKSTKMRNAADISK